MSDYSNFVQRFWNGTTPAFSTNENITEGFKDYIMRPNLSYEYATMFVGTLPGQRYEYYTDSNFDNMKQNVLGELNKMSEALGFYNVNSTPVLLKALVLYDYALLFIGLIFDILLIIFIVVAVLLIYSLLLISVETKTFEIGVMRLVGLTKLGFVSMILT